MNLIACLVLSASTLTLPADGPDEQHRLQARVDPRVELMCIIFRLAGNPEYNQPNSKSPYADEVEAHFGAFRDQPVVRTAQRLRARRGVSYDAVMSMAMHLEDAVSLKEKIPFDQSPPRLDSRWRLRDARKFLEQARRFVRETEFNQFYAAHQELYAAAADRMSKKLNQRAYLEWFDSFFGARPGAKFHVMVGMLNGGCCYGVGLRYPDGREEITPVLGVWKFDQQGIPIIDDGIVPTVVHEFGHSYTNPLVDKHADQLQPAGTRIFPHCAEQMKRQAYGNWRTMMRESLVRACVVRYMLASDGKSAARKEARRQHERGFKWTGELSKLLGEYESHRDRYPTLDAFMPKVVEFFNEYAEKYEKQQARTPKVVSMIPANGATDVDPNLREIKITFDRPMMDKSWSLCGGGPDFPEITGDMSYDKQRKVLTVPVRLKPNWTYHLGINCLSFRNFISQDGTPVEPVAVTFKTRGE